MSDRIAPIRPGVTFRNKDDLVEFFAQRLVGFVEEHGVEPDTLVFAMWADGDVFHHGTSFVSRSGKMSKVMAHGTAAALLQRGTIENVVVQL